MSQETQVAKSFVDFYYSTFDRNRNELLPLYRPHSMLSFEGQGFQGAQQIVEKLTVIIINLVIAIPKGTTSSSYN
jgi:hypothetical protein